MDTLRVNEGMLAILPTTELSTGAKPSKG